MKKTELFAQAKHWLTDYEAVILTGPTASGKSALALELAQQIELEIITVDSAQIYRDMNIGTAKPSPLEQAQVKHHLLDLRDASERYSVAEFLRDCDAAIAAIKTRGKLPLLVGGTMMYVNALRNGLSTLPPTRAEVAAEIAAWHKAQGSIFLHDKLKTLDTESAQTLAPGDTQRVSRALEVVLSTGKTLPQWQRENPPSSPRLPPAKALHISIEPPREVIIERCAARFEAMLQAGFEQEVRTLYERGDLHTDLPAIRCVGYRQMWQYFAGDLSLDEAVNQSIIATRQLAKRQMTWLRSMPQRVVIEASA